MVEGVLEDDESGAGLVDAGFIDFDTPAPAAPGGLGIADAPARDRTAGNMFAWGAALGAFSQCTLNIMYLSLCGFTSDPQGQIDRYNPFANVIDNGPGRTALAYFAVYMGTASLLMGAINTAYRNSQQNKQRQPDEETTVGIDSGHQEKLNVTDLFQEVAIDGKLNYSRAQIAGLIGFNVLFFIANAIYDVTFLDVGNEAIKLMPDYGSPYYKALNQQAGAIGYFYNLFLNQYFAAVVSSLIADAYNIFKFLKSSRPNDAKLSNLRTSFFVGLTLVVSAFASIAFLALTADDKGIKKYPDWFQDAIFYSTIPVYGMVLNTLGSKQFISDIKNVWGWLKSFPLPLYRFALSAALLPHNVKEWSREIFFLLSYIRSQTNIADSKFVSSFTRDYKFPVATNATATAGPINASGEATGLLSAAAPATDGGTTSSLAAGAKTTDSLPALERLAYPDGKTGGKPAASVAQIQAKVDRRIRGHNPPYTVIEVARQYEIVAKELETQRTGATSYADIWKHGRVRASLQTPFTMMGVGAVTIILFSYYFAVKKITAQTLGLDPNYADTAMVSFLMFTPFIRLVQSSTSEKMTNIFAGIENKTYATAKFVANPTKYLRQLGWNETTAKFAIHTLAFSLQIFAFISAGPSSSTVAELLDEIPAMKAHYGFFVNIAFWGTSVFNSIGIASFISLVRNKVTDQLFYYDDKPALNASAKFANAATGGHGVEVEDVTAVKSHMLSTGATF